MAVHSEGATGGGRPGWSVGWSSMTSAGICSGGGISGWPAGASVVGLMGFTVTSDSFGVPDEVDGETDAVGATDVDGVDVCSS